MVSLFRGYTENCENKNEYPWIYYYIKYNVFRTGRYGKYWWSDYDNTPYVFTTLFQRRKMSENSYNPFLKVLKDNVSREHFGNRIYITEKEYMIETQKSYQIISNEDDAKVLREFKIYQNEKTGIDSENRVEKMKREISIIN